MSMLTPTEHRAEIVLLAINSDGKDLTTSAVNRVEVSYEGFVGDSHSGLTRSSCVRVKKQYPVGTDIRNTRQISALSMEEIESIQSNMAIDTLDPQWLGANLVLRGIHDFSKIPPSSRLIADNGTSLVVDMENAPCRFPGDIIESHRPGKGVNFVKSAQGKRGVTLWVENAGLLATGDSLRLHVPPRCNWQ